MKFVLGIESSCDNTCFSIINNEGYILLNYNINQEYLLSKFGGYIPNMLSDNHALAFQKIFNELDIDIFYFIDAIAVTNGPGLLFSLAIGHRLAVFISHCFNKPLFFVDHIEAHALSPLFENKNLSFPYLSLIVSGGHFILFHMKKIADYELLSYSLDDSPGEVFDKLARCLNFELANGISIENAAKEGSIIKELYNFNIKIDSNLKSNKYINYSFSGIKTKFIRYIESQNNYSVRDVCFTFQEKIFDVIIKGLTNSISLNSLENIPIAISGGVACNNVFFEKLNVNFGKVFRPSNYICIDNAIMIANCYLEYKNICYSTINKSFLCKDIYPYDRFVYGNFKGV